MDNENTNLEAGTATTRAMDLLKVSATGMSTLHRRHTGRATGPILKVDMAVVMKTVDTNIKGKTAFRLA